MGTVPLWRADFNFCIQDKCVESLATRCFVVVVTGTEEIWLCRPLGNTAWAKLGRMWLFSERTWSTRCLSTGKMDDFYPPSQEALICLTTGMESSRYLWKEDILSVLQRLIIQACPLCLYIIASLSAPIYSSWLHSSYAPLHTSPSSNS